MSFLSKNWFLLAIAVVVSLLVVNVSPQETMSGWLYQTIELLLIVACGFAVLKLVSMIKLPIRTS